MTMFQNSNLLEYSSVPGLTDPEALAINYRKHLVQSLDLFIGKVSESFKIDLKAYKEKIRCLDIYKRFSPALFVYYDLLRDGYRTKNLHRIFDALQGIKNLAIEDCYTGETLCGTILSEAWELFCLSDLRQPPIDEEGQMAERPIQMLSLVHWDDSHFPPQVLKEAIEWMKNLDPALKGEFDAYVTRIKLYMGKVLESTTSSRFFGAVYMRTAYPNENPFLLYLRNMTHELSHLHLFAMMAEDPLVLNQESERFASPLRSDKRPMIGIFHAVFVLSRMVRILRKYLEENPKKEDVSEMLKKNESLFLDGFETVRLHASLSEKGKDIFKSLKTCAFE